MSTAASESNKHLSAFVLAGAAFAYYLLLSFWSDGFYGHDEIGHFTSSAKFWKDPSVILTYWQRPGFKLLYVVPVLGGIKVVHVLTAIITTLTGLVTYYIARTLNLKNAYLALLFLAFQPLLVQLSFRLYAEVLSGLLVALLLLTYLRQHWRLCALLAGYAFTVRQELALIGFVLLIDFVRRRDILSIALLALGPATLAVVGWIHSGNPLWVVQDFLPIGEYDQKKPGFFHYWRHFAIIFGGPVTVFFLIGFLSPLFTGSGWKETLSKYRALYFVFGVFFLLQCWLTAEWVTSPSPGHFRYLIYLGPVVAVFAAIGFNTVWEHRSNRVLVGTLVSMWLLFAVFGTYHHNYYAYHHKRDLLTLSAFAVLGLFLLVALVRQWKLPRVLLGMSVLLFVYVFVTERPLAMDSEAAATFECAGLIKEDGLDDRTIFTNHGIFSYALGPKQAGTIRTPGLYQKTIDEAPLGALIVWDNHYGEHPIFKTDLPADVVLERKDLRTLHACEGLKFQIVVMEKIEPKR